MDKTAEAQLRRYRLLVFRDSMFFLILAHGLMSALAYSLQYLFPEGFIAPTELDIPEDEADVVKAILTETPEPPGFWHFYFIALILVFFILGVVYIILKLFTNVLPDNMWFPGRGFFRGDYRGGWFRTRNYYGGGGGPRDAAAGIMVCVIFMLIILGGIMAIGIGAYLIEQLMRRHYKITWLLEETQKYVVSDLSNDEEHQVAQETKTETNIQTPIPSEQSSVPPTDVLSKRQGLTDQEE